MELICTGEFFKKLKLHEPTINIKEIRVEEGPEDLIFSHFFSLKKTFIKVSVKTELFIIIFRDTLALEISYCLSANHNPEFGCVICTGVTLELHCSQPIRIEYFFMYITSIMIAIS